MVKQDSHSRFFVKTVIHLILNSCWPWQNKKTYKVERNVWNHGRDMTINHDSLKWSLFQIMHDFMLTNFIAQIERICIKKSRSNHKTNNPNVSIALYAGWEQCQESHQVRHYLKAASRYQGHHSSIPPNISGQRMSNTQSARQGERHSRSDWCHRAQTFNKNRGRNDTHGPAHLSHEHRAKSLE